MHTYEQNLIHRFVRTDPVEAEDFAGGILCRAKC